MSLSAPRSRGRSSAVRRTKKSAQRAAASRKRGTVARSSRSGASAKLTTDHEEIRQWAEERGGKPATIRRTAGVKDPEGILRIDFPGFSGARSLKPVSWNEWFDVFEERRLGFLHQDRTASGKPSRFNKLVCRR